MTNIPDLKFPSLHKAVTALYNAGYGSILVKDVQGQKERAD